MTNLLLSVSPLLFVVILSAWFRRPAFIVAWYGVALVGVLVLVCSFLRAEPRLIFLGCSAAALITLQAALVIGPGLLLNLLLDRAKAHEALVEWVRRIPMDPSHKRLMVVVGIAPALESLTGFGVSLLVTVPLLLAASERRVALRQALLSMNIMPWGTLGLATAVGAQLSGQSVNALGFSTSLVSIAVFPLFGMLVGLQATQREERRRACRDGIFLGCVLSLSLVTLNRMGVVELAGILAGLASALTCLLLFCREVRAMVPPWRAVQPYAVVLSLVALIRALPFLGVPTKDWSIEAGGVHFAPLASPALALLIAIGILAHGQDVRRLLQETCNRAVKPILALGGFTLMAQMMAASGMIRTIGNALPIAHPVELGAMSSLLGAVSGYLTGSNVGGNALMMNMQASLASDALPQRALSAIQNSTAGHAVFASMPIILLVLAIAGREEKSEESALVRFGLKTMLLTVALQALTSVALITLAALG